MGLVAVASFVGPVARPRARALLQVGSLVGRQIYLFVFAPTIDVRRGPRDARIDVALVRAGRMPGAGNPGSPCCMIPTIALLVAPGKPGSDVGVNPTNGAWVFMLAIDLLQISMLAAFSIRYLSVADEVPEAAPRPAWGQPRPARTR